MTTPASQTWPTLPELKPLAPVMSKEQLAEMLAKTPAAANRRNEGRMSELPSHGNLPAGLRECDLEPEDADNKTRIAEEKGDRELDIERGDLPERKP